jgi:lipoprotein-releasing system permease protein
MPFELRIAARYMTARRKQAFVSVISGISILGVGLGVAALMIALGLMTGLQTEIQQRILGATAHVSVFRSGREPFPDWDDTVRRVRATDGVVGAAPAAYAKALLTTPSSSAVATLKAIDPAQEGGVTDVIKQLVGGSFTSFSSPDPTAPPPIVLGHELAGGLGVTVGDIVTVTTPRGHLSPFGILPRLTRCRVAGTVRSGLYEFDSAWAYVPLAASDRLLEGASVVRLVEVRLSDMFAVRPAVAVIKANLGSGYVTSDWIQMNESLFSALWLEKVAIGLTIALIVAVAALNIVATLVLMVMEKHKDIAILVSMGASRGAVMRIFMAQGMTIGVVGTALGTVVGWGACRVLDHYRLLRVPEDVYQIAYVPFRLVPAEAAAVVAGALFICFLATLHPAWSAARVIPAEALRYE